jgi:hypothetical protein
MGNMSKGKDKGIEKICSSKPTWFDSRTAKRSASELFLLQSPLYRLKPAF